MLFIHFIVYYRKITLFSRNHQENRKKSATPQQITLKSSVNSKLLTINYPPSPAVPGPNRSKSVKIRAICGTRKRKEESERLPLVFKPPEEVPSSEDGFT